MTSRIGSEVFSNEETVDNAGESYKILHTVLFTYTVQEGVVVDTVGKKYWLELVAPSVPSKEKRSIYEENYLVYPITEDQYQEFFSSRTEYCQKSGEPFHHGDPVVIHAVAHQTKGGVFIGVARNEWLFDTSLMRSQTPITVPASLITNLVIPLKVTYA